MTAVVVLEHARLGDVVRVDPRAASVGESTVYLRGGEELTVEQLLRALLVPSANDAAEALALYVGHGSVERFIGADEREGRASSVSRTRTSRTRTGSTRSATSRARAT